MTIQYLNPDRVFAKKQTDIPRGGVNRSGYGSKIPTSWMLQLCGSHTWHRVYVICYSNSGSCYIKTKAGNLYLGSYDPRD